MAGGPRIEFDSQTGLGLSLGIGGQYRINNQWRVYVNPIVQQYATVSFSTNHEKLTQGGIRAGIGYTF